ncbi:MAG: pyridoxal-phosphate dependent enzyme [Chloroflexota bacterium]
MIALVRVRAATDRAAPHVLRSPVLPLAGQRWLKLECLQPAGSFKVRGYFAAALALPEARRRAGLLTVSAGNAAAGCAYAAHRLGVPCRVVMFESAPAPKVEAVRRWGAEPTFLPREELFRWMAERGWESEPEAFIHPHIDEELAAGHGGIGLELLDQVPDLGRVLVPVGGGGLVTGVAAALKGIRPDLEVVGVMSDGYPLWPRALNVGGDPHLRPETIADGTAAPFNAVMFERLRECVDRWLVVPEPRLKMAISELAAAGKVVAEGAAALAYAALEQLPEDRPTAALVTGGNIAPALLAELLAGAA